MARVSWASRAVLLLVAVTVMLPAPASAQGAASPVQGSIANPNFPCGEPYGSNGEPPAPRRVARQIILPDFENYQKYLRILLQEAVPDIRSEDFILDDEPPESAPYCGATVISDHFIITAAHCIYKAPEPITSVTLGDIDLSIEGEENSRAVDYTIADIFVHPGYSNLTSAEYNDVALLKTKEKIQFNDVVFPFCISDEVSDPGTIVLISGFGLYNATTQPDHLLEANLTVMDTAECEEIYIQEGLEESLRLRYPDLLQGTDIICATDEVSDACQGDSGGPVLIQRDGKLFLEGIVSAGVSCRGNFKPLVPGLYLSLAKHIDFINEHVFSV